MNEKLTNHVYIVLRIKTKIWFNSNTLQIFKICGTNWTPCLPHQKETWKHRLWRLPGAVFSAWANTSELMASCLLEHQSLQVSLRDSSQGTLAKVYKGQKAEEERNISPLHPNMCEHFSMRKTRASSVCSTIVNINKWNLTSTELIEGVSCRDSSDLISHVQ